LKGRGLFLKILVTGGTGLIGTALGSKLVELGHSLDILTRQANFKGLEKGTYITRLDYGKHYDAIINLAGEQLNAGRWNNERKLGFLSSRVCTTEKIIEYISQTSVRPQIFISASAIGFYGSSLDIEFTETSKPESQEFTQALCDEWEKTALKAKEFGVRTCLMRIGIVLSPKGGALKAMIPSFKMGVGSQLGDGTQWMSWIHIDDVVGIFLNALEDRKFNVPINVTAPNPVQNKEFVGTLAKTLKRPCLFTLPKWLVSAIFGEMGETLLLKGQKVIPENALRNGYNFRYPYLEKALINLLKGT
jgi:uncharacterized protein (TIGR01777 family)